ncbi:MAG TPA: helix-turn-helix transcriptional regulator [Candidatus Polarisedimenticolia bacterium]|jgi:transcriptional regulator with XRE-family HTH domain|nr:helix-turn-helix transcriptional regulator [Candidatus Polarisedimenticolia bacterium]
MQKRGRHVQPSSGPEKAFGQALRKLRLQTGMSQERLALECEFDRTYISLLERGIQSPTLRTMIRLCNILHVSFTDMATHVDSFLSQQPARKRST